MNNQLDPSQEIEFWRRKASEYEWLFRKQKDLTESYRGQIRDYRQQLGISEEVAQK